MNVKSLYYGDRQEKGAPFLIPLELKACLVDYEQDGLNRKEFSFIKPFSPQRKEERIGQLRNLGGRRALFFIRQEMNMFVWVLFLIFTIVAYIMIASVILPRYYLKTRYTVDKSEDRGIKKVLEVNGQSLVFEPEIKWRKYVKQYVLSERDGEKQLQCKISENITYLELDVVLFNNQDKVFSVVKFKDLVEKSGYTKTISLPEQTSYVSIVVCKVDGEEFDDHLTAKVKSGRLFKFLLACSLLMVMEIMCLKVCCANIFGGVFRESFVLNWKSALVTLVMAIVAILVNIIVTAIALKIREVNYHKGNKR